MTNRTAELIDKARSGDRRALARLVSFVEDDADRGVAALRELYPSGGSARTTGVTGAPGAGKSSLVDLLLDRAATGGDVAVVAVDPSSPFTGGAILGDRVRMQRHAGDPRIFIRSMANRGHLGGLSAATMRAVVVLDALGFAEIIIETVGVGQAEVEIATAADTVIVVVNPGWGDAVQAAKAGLLEIGDIFAVNKADRPGADETVGELNRMLDLNPAEAWRPPVIETVATSGDGVEALWSAVGRHRDHLVESEAVVARQQERARRELETALRDEARRRIDTATAHPDEAIVDRVARRDLDPWSAARAMLEEQ